MVLKRVGILLVVIVGIALTLKLFNFSVPYSDPEKEAVENDNDRATNYRVYAPQIPDTYSFAGEEVPLNNFSVYERFDKEILKNTFFHSSTILYMKRAYKYFPVIEPILKENGIPDDFKYLAIIESGLENVVSPAGAAGYWQFMKTTARSYGLEVGSEIDERYHLEKSTLAACQYLKDAHKKFGNWTLVAASYNMGMGGLNKRLSAQNVESYYDLLLNQETGRYVYRILAVKRIFERPQMHGFYMSERDLYAPWDTYSVEVDSIVPSWIQFSQQYKVSYRVFKDLNPWLRKTYLKNPSRKNYKIFLPNKSMMQTIENRNLRTDKLGVFGDEKQ